MSSYCVIWDFVLIDLSFLCSSKNDIVYFEDLDVS